MSEDKIKLNKSNKPYLRDYNGNLILDPYGHPITSLKELVSDEEMELIQSLEGKVTEVRTICKELEDIDSMLDSIHQNFVAQGVPDTSEEFLGSENDKSKVNVERNATVENTETVKSNNNSSSVPNVTPRKLVEHKKSCLNKLIDLIKFG